MKERSIPASFAQQRMWFINQMQPKSAAFHLHTAVRIGLSFDPRTLERVLNEIVRRHDSLRTRFAPDNEGDISQFIVPSHHLSLPVTDLSALPASERNSEAVRLSSECAREPFDLGIAPLLRVRLLRLAESEQVFLFTIHHIVSDGWSMGIFWKELETIWNAFAAGQLSPLPELRKQYSDYVAWERQELQKKDGMQRQLEYWKTQLADSRFLDLRNSTYQPTPHTLLGAHYRFEIPSELITSIQNIANREGATLFMALFAAFISILARLTGETDLAIGTYVAGRNHPDFEPLIGFFLNTLVLRVDLSGNPTFQTLLHRVRNIALDAYANQSVPFARVVEEIQPARDLNRNPLFEILFQLLNVPTLKNIGAGREPDLLPIESGASVFDLTCTINQSANRTVGEFEYKSTLFGPNDIRALGDRYLRVLQCIAGDPNRPLSRLPILTPRERRLALRAGGAMHVGISERRSLATLFEAQVKQTPRKVALMYNGSKLLYNELNRRVNCLASYLQKMDIGREDLVGVCLERSFEAVVAILAVTKVGAAFLPLDPSYPPERISFMARHSQAKVIITCKSFRPLLCNDDAQIVCVDTLAKKIAACSKRNLRVRTKPSNLAYVIYTSGSTGQPKGVAVECAQILNRLAWMWKRYPFGPHEVSCQKTRLSFVDAIWEIFGPLLKGCPTVIIPDTVVLDPHALVETLRTNRVTRIWVVPSFLREVLKSFPDLRDSLPHLTFWVASGEELTVELYERFERAMPHATLFNLYGTSEVWDATWYDPRTRIHEAARIPIGLPIPNVLAYVLDRNLEPVPPATPGELHIGGIGLARGYLDDPGQTTSKFILNPFLHGPNSRLYKTGDLARWTQDGNLEFLGRIDHQVKLRGHRVELGEIESLLRNHETVDHAVVLFQKESQNLCAYVSGRNELSPSETELRRYLRSKVPEYMLPARFVTLQKMPLTGSGKLNRCALPLPSAEATCASPNGLNKIQDTVLTLWRHILRRDSIGLDDNFFDLGGHSLMLMRMLSRLNTQIDSTLTINDLFRHTTVNSLSNLLDLRSDERKSTTSSLIKIKNRVRKQQESLNPTGGYRTN